MTSKGSGWNKIGRYMLSYHVTELRPGDIEGRYSILTNLRGEDSAGWRLRILAEVGEV